ncbi:MAG: hypothetical protein JNK54_02725 [Elusimicrobia bacterium]|jgi:hypothetical protein|nr:hypothetical protein [Elusimicrobiota bacterium]
MNRLEKMVAFVLGTLVFIGLFVFIYTSMKAPPVTLSGDEASFYGEGDDFIDFNELVEPEDEEKVVPPPNGKPGDSVAKPVAKKEPKK